MARVAAARLQLQDYHAGGAASTMNVSPNAGLRQVISADQIQKRVRELGRQISDDYRGETKSRVGYSEKHLLVHGRPGAGGRCPPHLLVYQAELQAEPAG